VIDCRPLGAEKDSRPVGGLRGGSCRGDPPRRRPGGGEPFDIPIGRCAVVRDSWGNVLVLLDVTKGSLMTDANGIVLSDRRGAPQLKHAPDCHHLITDAETVRSRCLGLMPADSAAREIGVA
jgi:hypothetical protein